MLLGVLAWAGPAQATDQLPDLIQIDGQQAALLAEPLSGPLDDPATWKRFVAHAGSAPGSCSANWRGYRAYWRLDGQLVLDRLVPGRLRLGAAHAAAGWTVSGPASARARRLVGWGELIVALPATATSAAHAAAPYVVLQLGGGQLVARQTLTEELLRARHAAAANPQPAH